jgi:hypothetical protein
VNFQRSATGISMACAVTKNQGADTPRSPYRKQK